MQFRYHIPVMVQEVARSLKLEQAELILDVTLGDGGYLEYFLPRMPLNGMALGIDLDKQALERARQRLSAFSDRVVLRQGNFKDVSHLVYKTGFTKMDGIVADLGVSMLQITDPSKGFSYLHPGPLKMTMNPDQGQSAESVINEYKEEDLSDIIYQYGEERQARRIAKTICSERKKTKIMTTEHLANVIKKGDRSGYPIKTLSRVFQAIRIFVNDELENLSSFLPQAVDLLKSGGRLAVVTYHSLEDRRVKHFFQKQESPCECSSNLPYCICGKKPTMRRIGKMIIPDSIEIEKNKSARSAKLRVAEKI